MHKNTSETFNKRPPGGKCVGCGQDCPKRCISSLCAKCCAAAATTGVACSAHTKSRAKESKKQRGRPRPEKLHCKGCNGDYPKACKNGRCAKCCQTFRGGKSCAGHAKSRMKAQKKKNAQALRAEMWEKASAKPAAAAIAAAKTTSDAHRSVDAASCRSHKSKQGFSRRSQRVQSVRENRGEKKVARETISAPSSATAANSTSTSTPSVTTAPVTSTTNPGPREAPRDSSVRVAWDRGPEGFEERKVELNGKPALTVAQAPKDIDRLPRGWSEHKTSNGTPYYFHPAHGSRWMKPELNEAEK
eukprot:657556-Amorphochlora_amoeboformis.AAC.1